VGGPGIVMAKETFQVVNISGCGAPFRAMHQGSGNLQTSLYDDVIIGMWVQRHIGLGCWWDDPSYHMDTFAHNHEGSDSFPSDDNLWNTISLHPHKTPGTMTMTHERFKKLVCSAAPWLSFFLWVII
jgi:hypothetical protein